MKNHKPVLPQVALGKRSFCGYKFSSLYHLATVVARAFLPNGSMESSVTTEVFWSENRRGKEDKIGESQPF
jgi:hypothetical protein